MIGWILVLLYFYSGYADILRVPVDYPDIQAALDVVQEHDTVLVDTGTYAEALVAPPLSFLLKGSVVSDSIEIFCPIVDPSSIIGSDSLACLIITQECGITIEDMNFKNGNQMYPRRGLSYYGGIINFSDLAISLKRCRIDSAYGGLVFGRWTRAQHVYLENCSFFNANRIGVYSSGELHARDCIFIGTNCLSLASGLDNSELMRCNFSGNTDASYTSLSGENCIIQDCVFGPGLCHGIVGINSWGRTFISRNIFEDISLTGYLIDIRYRDGSPVVINENYIAHNTLSQGQMAPLWIQNDGPGDTANLTAIIEENIFNEYNIGLGFGVLPKSIQTDGRINIHRNHFINVLPTNDPVIRIGERFVDPGNINDNIFINNGFAIKSYFMDIDATHNYWGDPSGPRHSSNPLGLGDSVSNNVLFTPWYTDTSFFNLSSDNPRALHPSSFSLSVFPNPFNSSAKIKLQVKEPMIVKVDLFDLLGRKVKELYNAPVAYEKEISFQADNLSSGVYFVRATETIWNRPLATQKMLLLK